MVWASGDRLFSASGNGHSLSPLWHEHQRAGDDAPRLPQRVACLARRHRSGGRRGGTPPVPGKGKDPDSHVDTVRRPRRHVDLPAVSFLGLVGKERGARRCRTDIRRRADREEADSPHPAAGNLLQEADTRSSLSNRTIPSKASLNIHSSNPTGGLLSSSRVRSIRRAETSTGRGPPVPGRASVSVSGPTCSTT